jgi:hypothetical protein
MIAIPRALGALGVSKSNSRRRVRMDNICPKVKSEFDTKIDFTKRALLRFLFGAIMTVVGTRETTDGTDYTDRFGLETYPWNQ